MTVRLQEVLSKQRRNTETAMVEGL